MKIRVNQIAWLRQSQVGDFFFLSYNKEGKMMLIGMVEVLFDIII